MTKHLLTFLLGSSVSSSAFAAPIVFSVGGNATTESIQTTVDTFRAALGDPNNGNNPGARREINWDGGGVNTSVAGGNPFNVFLNTRGAQFTTPGTDFFQAPETGGPQGGLEMVFNNPTYGTAFTAFSASRLFAPVGSNIIDATFFVPGTNGGTQASVQGFGAVFTDVDLLGGSTMTFFDLNNNPLTGPLSVPVALVPDGGFSFLGVFFNAGEQIGRLRIVAGTNALGPNDNPAGGVDLAVIDDVLYSEPASVAPEPAVLSLLGLGAMAAVARRRRRPF